MNKLMRLGNASRFVPSIFDDDFFSDFFDTRNSLPATNVSETKDAFKVELSVPGFSKDNFNVEVHNNVLTISGNVEEKKEEKGDDEKVLRREFKSSSFRRAFTLPDSVDTENIDAQHKDGVLILTIPKVDESKKEAKKIDIK